MTPEDKSWTVRPDQGKDGRSGPEVLKCNRLVVDIERSTVVHIDALKSRLMTADSAEGKDLDVWSDKMKGCTLSGERE